VIDYYGVNGVLGAAGFANAIGAVGEIMRTPQPDAVQIGGGI
jgi:hypothetical protein